MRNVHLLEKKNKTYLARKMIISNLIGWYLFQVPFRIIESERVLIVWIWRFFSIGYFLPRVFSPWHKDITGYGRGFDFKIWAHAFVWNLISRIIGAILRLFFVLLGMVLEVLAVLQSAAALAVWYALPLLIAYLLISGVSGL